MSYIPSGYPAPLKIRSTMGGFATRIKDSEEREAILAELRREYFISKAYHAVFKALLGMTIMERQQFLGRLRVDLDKANRAAAR